MLHWTSPWERPPAGPTPPPCKPPSVFDRWLAETGRVPVRYTARRRLDHQSATTRPSQSLTLVWPARSPHGTGSDRRPFRDTTAAPSTTSDRFTFADRNKAHHQAQNEPRPLSGQSTPPTQSLSLAATDGNHGEAAPQAREWQHVGQDHEPDADWDDASCGPSIFLTDAANWRDRIIEMIDMGMTHYNVFNCTQGMATKDDIAHYDRLIREVIAEHPEVGTVEVIQGYPPVYVLLGAPAAAAIYAERRRLDREQRYGHN